MENKKQFKKLSEIQTIKPVKFIKKFYSRWDEELKKYENVDVPTKGYSAKYIFECEDFLVSLSSSQFGQMLEACWMEDCSIPVGKIFRVNTNGKTGIEIRYYINLDYQTVTDEISKREEQPIPSEPPLPAEPNFDDMNIPF